MSAPTPATIVNEINESLATLILNAPQFFRPDDFRVLKLSSEIGKLMKVDAANAYLLRAGLEQLVGNEGEMRRALKCAANLTNDLGVYLQSTSCLMNLGFFSDAQRSYIAAGDPTRGGYTSVIAGGLYCGAFSAMVSLMKQADKLNLEIPADVRELALNAHKILMSEGVTDEFAGRIFDVAGDVMRDAGRFFYGLGPQVLPIEDEEMGRCVYVTFLLAAPVEEVVAMQVDLACRLADRFPEMPTVLSVGFQAVTIQ